MLHLLLITSLVFLLLLKIFALVDCILRDRKRVRVLTKEVWIILIVMMPVVGPALWLLIGRGRHPREKPHGKPRSSEY